MGIIISRFKKKLSTKEQLEKLQHEIEFLEDYKLSTLRSQKHVVRLLFFISGIVFTIATILLYFYKFNESTHLLEKIVYSVLLALFLLLVYGAKRGLQWYYVWTIDALNQKLRPLKREKQKILEKVMETETYKVANELLEKYYDPPALIHKTEPRLQVQRVQDSSYSLRNRNISLRFSPNTSCPTPDGNAQCLFERLTVQQTVARLEVKKFDLNNTEISSFRKESEILNGMLAAMNLPIVEKPAAVIAKGGVSTIDKLSTNL